MGGLTLYRHDHRDIPDSDPMPPAGDHYKELTPEQKMAEDAIRAGKSDGTQIRAESLYVYSDLEMVERDWERKKGRHLYKLEIDGAVIRHRGDLLVFHEVMNAIKNKESPDGLVRKYWNAVDEGCHAELLVSKATVVEARRRACVRTASSSFDHLVGAQPYQQGYRKVKRLGGLEVQDHLEFYRHLNG
jgi:hypothetical protein